MGYCINPSELFVRIPKANRRKLLNVFKKLREERDKLGSVERGPGKRVYCWADEFEYSTDLVAMFDAFRYILREEGEFYIVDEWDGEKIGDDYILWGRIKPLCTADSQCEFVGEDGAQLDFFKE